MERANERMDEQVAQYLRLGSWLMWPILEAGGGGYALPDVFQGFDQMIRQIDRIVVDFDLRQQLDLFFVDALQKLDLFLLGLHKGRTLIYDYM